MLTITVTLDDKSPTLRLEGRLAEEWVAELEHSWREIGKEASGAPVAIGLSDVTYVDAKGKALLGTLFQEGANLQSHSLMTGFLIKQLKQGIKECGLGAG